MLLAIAVELRALETLVVARAVSRPRHLAALSGAAESPQSVPVLLLMHLMPAVQVQLLAQVPLRLPSLDQHHVED